jgi:hypothetical protein
MHNRLILGCILLFMTAAASVSANEPAAPVPGNTPEASAGAPAVVVKEAQFQFDPVMEGVVVAHEFVLENTGAAPLVIQNIKTGCGCTTADYDKVIPPGESGKIIIKANTKGYGGQTFLRDIRVDTNDPATPRLILHISGQVDQFADINPKSVFLRGKTGEDIQARVTISPNSKYPFHITGVRPSREIADKVKVDVESGQNHYGITIVNLLASPGSYYGNVQLDTDSAALPELTISVRGKIQ